MEISRRWNIAAALALGVAFLSVVLQVRSVEKTASRASEVEPPVLQYMGELQPEKWEFLPGESIYFHVQWNRLLHDREPIPVVVFSCFENQADGLTYPLTPVPHIIEGQGLQDRRIVRVLPPNILPGKYRFVGWAETHTDKIRQSARFQSLVFEVKSAPPAPAK